MPGILLLENAGTHTVTCIHNTSPLQLLHSAHVIPMPPSAADTPLAPHAPIPPLHHHASSLPARQRPPPPCLPAALPCAPCRRKDAPEPAAHTQYTCSTPAAHPTAHLQHTLQLQPSAATYSPQQLHTAHSSYSESAQHRPSPECTVPGAAPVQDELVAPPVRASSCDQTCELEVAQPIERATM